MSQTVDSLVTCLALMVVYGLCGPAVVLSLFGLSLYGGTVAARQFTKMLVMYR